MLWPTWNCQLEVIKLWLSLKKNTVGDKSVPETEKHCTRNMQAWKYGCKPNIDMYTQTKKYPNHCDF